MAKRSKAENRIAHPNPNAREFYGAFLQVAPKYEQQLSAALARREWLNPTHIADLLFRAAMFCNPYRQPWYDFLAAMDFEQVTYYATILATRNVATFIPARYRSLAALASHIAPYKPLGLRVTDWGCSLNLGLRYVLQPYLLLGSEDGLIPPLENHMDDIVALLSKRELALKDAIGIDIMDLSTEEWIDWTNVCSYGMQRFSVEDIKHDTPLELAVADVTKDPFDLKLSGRLFDIVHVSMMTHQISPSNYSVLLRNAALLLDTDGIYVELTFRIPNVFYQPRNTVTQIRFRLPDGSLSDPYTWLEWDTSQCRVVWPGKDFAKIEQCIATRWVM